MLEKTHRKHEAQTGSSPRPEGKVPFNHQLLGVTAEKKARRSLARNGRQGSKGEFECCWASPELPLEQEALQSLQQGSHEGLPVTLSQDSSRVRRHL